MIFYPTIVLFIAFRGLILPRNGTGRTNTKTPTILLLLSGSRRPSQPFLVVCHLAHFPADTKKKNFKRWSISNINEFSGNWDMNLTATAATTATSSITTATGISLGAARNTFAGDRSKTTNNNPFGHTPSHSQSTNITNTSTSFPYVPSRTVSLGSATQTTADGPTNTIRNANSLVTTPIFIGLVAGLATSTLINCLVCVLFLRRRRVEASKKSYHDRAVNIVPVKHNIEDSQDQNPKNDGLREALAGFSMPKKMSDSGSSRYVASDHYCGGTASRPESLSHTLYDGREGIYSYAPPNPESLVGLAI